MTGQSVPWRRIRLCTCVRCGFTFGTPSLVGARPRLCQTCRTVPEPKPGAFDPDAPGYRVSLRCTELTLAVVQAVALLRMDRPIAALSLLEQVEAPSTRRSQS